MAAKTQVPPQALAQTLRETLLQLRQIQSAVMVSVAALKLQACELDVDIALVLQRAVSERLNEQMDRLETSLQQLGRTKP